MESGTDMRNFEAYLARRRITDISSWAKKNGIATKEQLVGFCKSRNLRIRNIDAVLSMLDFQQSRPTVVEKNISVEVPAEVSEEEPTLSSSKEDTSKKEETWHVPAALRPLRKSSPDLNSTDEPPNAKSTTKRKTRKSTSRSSSRSRQSGKS